MNQLHLPNYQLWNISPKDFPQHKPLSNQLHFITSFGHLAPSSHNTQPWKFIIHQNTIEVHANLKRRLPAADPTDKELYISVGCTIPLIEIAALQFGFQPTSTLLPAPKHKTHIATIALTPADTKPSPLFPLITKRLTNRAKYNPRKRLPTPLTRSLLNIDPSSPIKLHLTTDQPTIKKLAHLTRQAMFEALSNPKFRNELASWVRHNWTKQGDGLPANTLGFPDAMSIILPTIVRSPVMASQASQEEEKLINSSSAIAVLTVPSDDLKSWIQTGHFYSLFALNLTKHKLAHEPLSATIEFEHYTKKLKHLLGIKHQPTMFIRVGYPNKPFPHAPRLPLDQVITIRS